MNFFFLAGKMYCLYIRTKLIVICITGVLMSKKYPGLAFILIFHFTFLILNSVEMN